MRKLLSIGTTIAGVYALYLASQFYIIYHASYKISRVVINNLSLTSASIVLYIEIVNNSNLLIIITDQKYDIIVNGTKVSSVDSKDPIILAKNDKAVMPLNINFSPTDIVKTGVQNLTAILTDKSKVNIEVKGSVSIKWKLINLKNINVDITYTLQELIDMSKQPKS
jgi:LEA14-like dessication related protein